MPAVIQVSNFLFDQADLNPLFNWNVKQLFLYLTAEYETPNNQLNQVSPSRIAAVWSERTTREVPSNIMLWAGLDVPE